MRSWLFLTKDDRILKYLQRGKIGTEMEVKDSLFWMTCQKPSSEKRVRDFKMTFSLLFVLLSRRWSGTFERKNTVIFKLNGFIRVKNGEGRKVSISSQGVFVDMETERPELLINRRAHALAHTLGGSSKTLLTQSLPGLTIMLYGWLRSETDTKTL